MKPVQEAIRYSTIVCRKANLIFNEIDGEIVLLSIDNEEYYNLNQVGSVIWDIIDVPTTIESIIMQLQENFDVSKSVCNTDTVSYIHDLVALGIVDLINE